MAKENSIYEEFDVDKEQLEEHIASCLMGWVKSPIQDVTITMDRLFKGRYRKDTAAGRFLVEIHYEGGRDDEKDLFLRKYRKDSKRDPIREKRLNKILYRTFEEDIVRNEPHWHTHQLLAEQRKFIPTILVPLGVDYLEKRFPELSMTYFTKKERSLAERLKGQDKINFEHLAPALDLSVVFLERLPHLMDKFEAAVKQEGYDNKDDPNYRDLTLPCLGMDHYLNSPSKVLDNSRLSQGERDSFKSNLQSLVRKYMFHENLETTIHANGYPWQNNTSYILDYGNIAFGSKSAHFGPLFGHPDVFNKLGDKESDIETLLGRMYDARISNLSSQFKHTANPHFDTEELLKGFYVSAICSNLNLLYEYENHLKQGEPEEIVKTVKAQAAILAKTDDEATEIYKIIDSKRPLDFYSKGIFRRLFGS